MIFAPHYLVGPPEESFPSVYEALDAHHGLLAISRDLHPLRIVTAYRSGIFPWYNEGEPIAWYSPPTRMVLPTQAPELGRRGRKFLRECDWTVAADTAFDEVLHACATVPRAGQDGTWINAEMLHAYSVLHEAGIAHAVEVRDAKGRLVGGLFGLAVRGIFCGDSMFSLESGASKVAFAGLRQFLASHGVEWIDGQLPNEYLRSLGGVEKSREAFQSLLLTSGESALSGQKWTNLLNPMPATALI